MVQWPAVRRGQQIDHDCSISRPQDPSGNLDDNREIGRIAHGSDRLQAMTEVSSEMFCLGHGIRPLPLLHDHFPIAALLTDPVAALHMELSTSVQAAMRIAVVAWLEDEKFT